MWVRTSDHPWLQYAELQTPDDILIYTNENKHRKGPLYCQLLLYKNDRYLFAMVGGVEGANVGLQPSPPDRTLFTPIKITKSYGILNDVIKK